MERTAAEPVAHLLSRQSSFFRQTVFLNGLLTKHSIIRKNTYPTGVTIPSVGRRSNVLVRREKQNRFQMNRAVDAKLVQTPMRVSFGINIWRGARQMAPVLALGVLGVAMSVASWHAMAEAETHAAVREFDSRAENWTIVLKNGIDDY